MTIALGTSSGFVKATPSVDPVGGTTTVSDGASMTTKHTTPNSGTTITVTEMGFYKDSGTTSSNFQCGIYADSAGVPGARSFVTSDAASGTTAGWKTIGSLNWTLSPNTAYHLAVQQDAHSGSSYIDGETSGGAGIDRLTSQSALPDPFGGGALLDADGIYAIYAKYTIGVSVTATIQSSTYSQPTPTITAIIADVTVSASIQASTYSQPTAVVSAVREAVATIAILTSVFTNISPVIATTKDISSSPVIEYATFSQPASVTTITRNINASVGHNASTFNVVEDPSVTTTKSIDVSPNVETAIYSQSASTVTITKDVEIKVGEASVGLVSLDKPYSYIVAPNGGASYPDTGGIELTDGVVSETWYDSSWVGWLYIDGSFTIDLETETDLDYSRFYFLRDTGGGVQPPLSVTISGSNNDLDFTSLGTFSSANGDWSQVTAQDAWTGNLDIAGSYRYIKYEMTWNTTPPSAWLFISEVEIYGASGGLSETATFSTINPVITAGYGVESVPATQSATFSTIDPNVSTYNPNSEVIPVIQFASFSQPDSVVSTVRNINISPAIEVGTYSQPVPVISVSKDVEIKVGEGTTDSYTKLLLHCDGSDEGTTFTDEVGHTVTNYNNEAKTDDVDIKFGTTSAKLGGGGVGHLALGIADSADFKMGSGDFTVDWWEYTTHSSPYSRIQIDGDDFLVGYVNAGQMQVYISDATGAHWNYTIATAKSMGTIIQNAWTHYALTRSGTTFRTFQNGTKITEWTSSASIRTGDGATSVGCVQGAGWYNQWIDEVRVSKGIARWTANFDVPTEAYDLGVAGQIESATFSTINPVVTVTKGIEVAASVNSATYSQPIPSLTYQDNEQVAVGVSSATWSNISPVVTTQRSVEVKVADETELQEKATLSQPASVVTTTWQVNIPAAIQTAVFSSVQPSITNNDNEDIAAGVNSATYSQIDPTVVAGSGVIVASELNTIISSNPDVIVETARATEVRPAVQTGSFSSLTPVITAYRNAGISGQLQSASFSVVNPEITITTSVRNVQIFVDANLIGTFSINFIANRGKVAKYLGGKIFIEL